MSSVSVLTCYNIIIFMDDKNDYNTYIFPRRRIMLITGRFEYYDVELV